MDTKERNRKFPFRPIVLLVVLSTWSRASEFVLDRPPLLKKERESFLRMSGARGVEKSQSERNGCDEEG